MKTAVLTDDYLYLPNEILPCRCTFGCEETLPCRCTFGCAAELCELGLEHNLDTIWVCPGSHISREIFNDPERIHYYANELYDVRVPERYERPAFGSVKRREGTWDEKRIVYFGFPEMDARWMTDDETWSLADVESPITFLEQMTALEAALTPRRVLSDNQQGREFHVRYSPGYTGHALIKEVLKLNVHLSWTREANLSTLPTHKELGGYTWKRPLTLDDMSKKYIHFFDRNAQFPAAATGAECGEGSPDYFPPEVHMHRPNLKLPGVWRVRVELPEGKALWDRLPGFALGEQWAYSPTIEVMELLGYKIEFHEGYQWPVHHRTLQDWAKHMWEARQSLKAQYGANSPACIMAKMIANRGLGWLEVGDGVLRRDDWANMVRSLARFRLTLKLKELADKGFYPIMIVADNIAYLSDDPNPETAVPGLMIRSTELGGFKHDGTYLLSQVLPLLAELHPNDIRREVKKLQKVQVNV